MTSPIRLLVPLVDSPYNIHIGHGWLAHVPAAIVEVLGKRTHAVIITDSVVGPTYGQLINQALARAGMRTNPFVVPSGETSKSIERLGILWDAMAACKTDRRSIVVAVGGGVVGDLAGFAAATYARGLDLIQIPTTLLGQVDSSVGGKTGINLKLAKNMVGSFWQPRLVAIDTQTLETLPDREFRSGLAEVVKYGMILDDAFFQWLEAHWNDLLQRDHAALEHAIAVSCQRKADVVCQDPHETSGLRAILNYGHTFAHALEAVAGYGQWLHGEAVAIGMHQAALLAHRIGRIDRSIVDRQSRLLQQLKLPITSNQPSIDSLLAAMMLDKKVAQGRLRFILPTRIGHVELVEGVDPTLVRSVLIDTQG
jgi:3-dehydroquinate synthase